MKVVQQHHLLHQSSEINCHWFFWVLYDSNTGFWKTRGRVNDRISFLVELFLSLPVTDKSLQTKGRPYIFKPGITDEQTFSLFACERLLITAISSSLSSQTPLILQIQGPFSVVKYDPINLIANRTVDEEPSHSDGIIRELRSSVV